jgi:hypothetical protein
VKIEVLYVSECPSHPAAVRLIKDVLAAEGVSEEIEEVLVRDQGMADALRFRGSPTIRINGCDVEEEESGMHSMFALSCRLYAGSRRVALPAAEAICRAVREARYRETS